jgi:hypothetical protein
MHETKQDTLKGLKENERLTMNPVINIMRIADDGWVYLSATFILMLIDPSNMKFAEDGFSIFHLNLFVSSIIVMAGVVFSSEMLPLIFHNQSNEKTFKRLTDFFEYITLKFTSCLTGLTAIVSGLGLAVNIDGSFVEIIAPIAYLLYPLAILTLLGIMKSYSRKNREKITKLSAVGGVIFVVLGIGLSWYFQVFGLFALS